MIVGRLIDDTKQSIEKKKRNETDSGFVPETTRKSPSQL